MEGCDLTFKKPLGVEFTFSFKTGAGGVVVASEGVDVATGVLLAAGGVESRVPDAEPSGFGITLFAPGCSRFCARFGYQ